MALSNLNHASNHEWSIDTTDFKYVKCAELELGKNYPLRGCFITKDNGYGKGAVFITDDCLVNVPQANVDIIEEINKNEEYIEQIETGHAAFVLSTYENKQKKICYDVKLIDC